MLYCLSKYFYSFRCNGKSDCTVYVVEKFNKVVTTFRCNGKSDCQVVSSVDTFGGDPCFGITKYTEVVYQCI
jgi:hypothetical protein